MSGQTSVTAENKNYYAAIGFFFHYENLIFSLLAGVTHEVRKRAGENNSLLREMNVCPQA